MSWATVLTKNVSWASRAGCCCGWKRESKFQKELSTHLLVRISSKPMRSRTCRISLLTLHKRCRFPPAREAPLAALKLNGLKSMSFHEPSRIMSEVSSAALVLAESKFALFFTANTVVLVGAIIFLFFKSFRAWSSNPSKFIRADLTVSSMLATSTFMALVALSMLIHLFVIAFPVPLEVMSLPNFAIIASFAIGPSFWSK
mmetsp:Transcript_147143/g.256832  ORF Transcript_147143/g.256832 Transcript_147143/m.256832 type:complete len:201 (+) Transcript_147143:788-1390(+)